MKLSTRSRYGVKLLLELALGENLTPITIKSIAEKHKISEKYLSKLIITLKGAGIVKAIRGMNGGYILAKRPSEIKMYDVVKVLEGDIIITEKIISENYCPVENMWQELNEVINNYLSNITLNDLLEDYKRHSENIISFHI